MGFKYTRSELAQLTGLSVETIKKRALKMGLKEEFKTVNNREVIAYELTESDLQELKHVLNQEIPFETPFKTVQPEFENPVKTPENASSTGEIVDKLIELSKYNDDRVEKYIERALNAERKYNLIETSEANKDAEINRLNALVKQLQAENEKLKQKSFFGIKLK
jgi:hypothetical protein